jgi:hypothetical protein
MCASDTAAAHASVAADCGPHYAHHRGSEIQEVRERSAAYNVARQTARTGNMSYDEVDRESAACRVRMMGAEKKRPDDPTSLFSVRTITKDRTPKRYDQGHKRQITTMNPPQKHTPTERATQGSSEGHKPTWPQTAQSHQCPELGIETGRKSRSRFCKLEKRGRIGSEPVLLCT